MLRCREVSRLVSESMDHRLSAVQRLRVWMHLAMCRLCAGFARQTRLLHNAARQNAAQIAAGTAGRDTRLSEQARRRIKAALRDR